MSKDWPVVRLDTVATIGAGNSAPQNKDAFCDDGELFIRTSDVGQIKFGEILTSVDKLTKDASKGFRRFRAGTVLIPKSGASTFNNHRVITKSEACVSSHLATVTGFQNKVEDRYLWYFLQTVSAQDLIQDQAYPSLSLKQISEIAMPLPPLDEQKRIVAKLDQALRYVDELNTTIQESLEQVGEFSKSAVSEVIEEQIDRVGAVRMDDIFTIARGGSPRPIKKFLTESNDGVNWIKISDATRTGKYITDTAEKISRDGISRSRYVEAGDLLLSNSMSFGRPYILKTDGCIHDGWLVLSSRQGEVDTEFMYYLLGSQFVYRQFDNLAAGSTVRNLNKDLVAGVKVPMPTLEVQQELMNRFREIESMTDSLTENLTSRLRDADSLRSSILASAFTGDL